MKKGLLLLAFLTFAAAAQAQIGVRAGIGSSNFSNGDVQRGFTSLIRPHFGVYYGMKATEKLTVEPGLFFSGKGMSTTSNITNKKFEESLSYLDIPVLARYAVNKDFNVFAGPQVGFLLARNYTEESIKITDTAPVGGYEIGGVFGVGYQLTSGINLQASYDFGIVPFKYFQADVNNTVFKLSVGYTIPSKQKILPE
ncbi:MAG: PorT family protein [Cyclobacteriaceae bacterium]|jgi:Outer membrane protein beta-barrel domain|nr:PorT family protein [Cyclobacteriaceae bacterium]